MNPKLKDAVALFKTLGWEDVTPDNIMSLPLGTAEQRQTALAGLRSGEWGEWGELKHDNHTSYQWNSYVDAPLGRLALFAVRIGVDVRRAVNILSHADIRNQEGDVMLSAAIAGRGAKYAADFIEAACVSRRRMFEHSASVYGGTAVRLVDTLDLTVPPLSEYIKDWACYAAAAMGLKAELRHGETDLPAVDLFEKRFEEHVRAGIAAKVPVTGPFGRVVPAGVKRGWLAREQAMELVFVALDAAVRPAERKIWLEVLDELEISDEQLSERVQMLIPLMASGDAAVVKRIAPVLIEKADSSLLTEVLVAAFSAETKKVRQLVLRAALACPCPPKAGELAPWLEVLAKETDKTISSLSLQLMNQWHISVPAEEEDTDEIVGLWQETPPVWQASRFALGEVSPEALTEAAARLVRQPSLTHDITAECFLAMANAVAYQDPEAARMSMRGLRGSGQLHYYAAAWVSGEEMRYGPDQAGKSAKPPLSARDYVVFQHLGEQPCLLSTPSTVDLCVQLSDLAARLTCYQQAGVQALEADLFLALTRLDLTAQAPEALEALQTSTVPILLQSGPKMSVTAGQAVLAFLADPVKEPPVVKGQNRRWISAAITTPHSLREFPKRLEYWYCDELFAVFPRWGDAAMFMVEWSGDFYHNKGLILRQVARRALPLPPGASVNLLAAQRPSAPDAVEDARRAVSEAWERGLLRPGVADIALLDWNAGLPTHLAALAAALDSIAQDGLLSVVWPILDALVSASLQAPRLLAGTAELAELIGALLPEVAAAMDKGAADKAALHLPGIRALAGRGGTSRAVSAARRAAEQLPPLPDGHEAALLQKAGAGTVMDMDFDVIWPLPQKTPLLIEDGVRVSVSWADPKAKTWIFLFTLTLPGEPAQIFEVVNNGWIYDLECEGQCVAYKAGFWGDSDNRVWLHWDAVKKAVVVSDKRNWFQRKDGPLSGIKPPPLSLSLLTVSIGLLAQDGGAVYFAPRLLQHMIDGGQLGEEGVRRATRILLQNPVISPAKLVRALEKNIHFLPVLWPMLTECIKAAGVLVKSGEKLPVWINRILDMALRYAPYLAEAARRGLISEQDARWEGLTDLAFSRSKSATVPKAKALLKSLTE